MTELVKCPACGKDVNPKTAVCPFCGGKNRDEGIFETPVCPRCSINLERRREDVVDVYTCPQCSGLWLDPSGFNILTAESTVYRTDQLKEEYTRPPLPEKIQYIPCAKCGKLMVRKNFGRISGVIIDECIKHGTWLDQGEFEKIRQFILDGGLEKEQFREIEKNRAELRDLAEKVDDVAFTQKLIHFWNWKRWFYGP